MLNLLIVEDNVFEGEALENYIDWDLLGIRVVETAFNGQDGLEKTKRLKPDIIISDIKMPVMDGITMAKAVREIFPDIKFVFLSGYNDVALFKEAIELQVHDYLIKPVSPEELIKSVKKTANALIEEKLATMETTKIKGQYLENLPLLQENFLRGLILKERDQSEGKVLFNQAGNLKLKISGYYKMALLDLDFKNTDIFETSFKTDVLLEDLKNICMHKNTRIFIMEQNKITVIMHSLPEGPDESGKIIGALQDTLETYAGRFEFKYIVGLSTKAPNLTDLSSLFRQCRLSLEKKIESGYGCVIEFKESGGEQPPARNSRRVEIKKAIRTISEEMIKGENVEDLVKDLAKILSESSESKLDSYQSVFIGLFSYMANIMADSGKSFEIIAEDELDIYNNIINIKTIPDLIIYTNKIVKSLSSCLGNRKFIKDEHIVNEILNILDNEYNRPITLAYLSDRVYLSPNYLRILFKDKMHISIQDYMTNIRISKAKEFLRHSRYKVQEIGGIVGYENNTYFNIVFKKHVNMTPGEYRSKYFSEAQKSE